MAFGSIGQVVSKSFSGFDPRSVPGCALWLDGADSNTMVGAPSAVTTWKDKSITSYSATSFTNGPTTSLSFAYTGANQTWTCPAGVTSITVNMWGGGGATNAISPYSLAGGPSAWISGNLAVTPGTVYTILVGGGGSVAGNAFGGGGGGFVGGGGRSAIINSNTSVELVTVGAGGAAGYANSGQTGYPGGAGGLATGSAGGAFTSPAGGGTHSAGGAAGGGTTVGSAGRLHVGGDGASGTSGGGSGYYGGGGSARASESAPYYNGGGGGGSSYTANLTNFVGGVGTTGTATAPGTAVTGYVYNCGYGAPAGTVTQNGGNGLVLISYVTPGPTPSWSPNITNNQGAISFNNSNGFSIPSFAITPSLSAFMVYYPNGQATSGPTVEQGVNATTTAGFLVQSQTPNFVIFSGSASTLTGTNTTSTNTWKLLAAVNADTSSASSNMSVYSNGTLSASNVTQAGTTLVTSTLYINGRAGTLTNSYASYLGELLIYSNALTGGQRQTVEGYLARKWGLNASMPIAHPFYSTQPFTRAFQPIDIPGCTLWLDAADKSTITFTAGNPPTVSLLDKSGAGNTLTGSATPSGNTLVFDGSTSALSNTSFVFPNTAFSMFAVYSNTTAPASTAYMNVLYGSNGYPMMGVYDVNKYVSMRGSSANTGALVANVAASSNVIVSSTYTGTTLSPFVNGTAETTLTATVAATTGLYIGGPSNYFNGSVSEILIYGSTLVPSQRQQVEGYLAAKWGLRTSLPAAHFFKSIPITSAIFTPTSTGTCTLAQTSPTTGTISWGSTSTNLTGYKWYIGTGSLTGVVATGSITNPLTYTTPFTYAFTIGTTYYAWIVPYNLSIVGPTIVSSSLTATAPPVSPGSCTLSLTGVSGGTINWGTSATTATGYSWYVGTGPQTGAITNGTVASGIYTKTFTYTLLGGTTYYAWVIPTNVGGNGTAAVSSGVTAALLPESPGSCTLTISTLTSATISWGTGSTRATGYSWYIGTGPQTGTVTSGTTASGIYTATVSYSFTGGSTYYGWVTPTNALGSGTTAVSSGTVAPTVVLLTTVGAGSRSVTSTSTIIIEVWGGGGSGDNNRYYSGQGGAYAKTTISKSGTYTVYYNVGAGGLSPGGAGPYTGQSSWVNVVTNAAPSSTAQGASASGGASGRDAADINQTANSVGNTIYIGGGGYYVYMYGPSGMGGGGSASSGGNGLQNGSGAQYGYGGNSGPGGGVGGYGNTSGSGAGGDGTSTTEGGGGSGGMGSGYAGAGGSPGGAGGASYYPTGAPTTYGSGGRGQVRITYA